MVMYVISVRLILQSIVTQPFSREPYRKYEINCIIRHTEIRREGAQKLHSASIRFQCAIIKRKLIS